jgi:preprotein translocase subunit YajC
MKLLLQEPGTLAPASTVLQGGTQSGTSDNGSLPAGGGPSLSPMLVMGLLFGFFWFFLIRPEKKRQKKLDQMRSKVSKGDKIVTAGGLHGTVTRHDEATITLKVDDNVRMKFDRNAIGRVASAEGEETPPADSGA